MIITADLGAKPQIKKISPENFPHGRLQAKTEICICEDTMIIMPVHSTATGCCYKMISVEKNLHIEGKISNFKVFEYQTVETVA